MDVKGTAIKTTQEFVRDTFPNKYEEWLKTLPESSKDYYNKTIMLSEWFPIKQAYLDPIDHTIDLCYDGDSKCGGEAIGQYSADMALKGVYKVFLLIASPKFLMQRASKIISTYYVPSSIVIEKEGEKEVLMKIVDFEEITTALEFRIAGWCKRALELANCNNVSYDMLNSMSMGDKTTEIKFIWE